MPHVIGIDLSGPTNVAETAIAAFAERGRSLQLVEQRLGASDSDLLDLVASLEPPVFVGLDAPLSYQPGGGQRVGDAALRSELTSLGLRSGTVMAPTMTRMAYLTLRGVSVARLLKSLRPEPAIVEVHPGGCMAFRGAPIESVRNFKSSKPCRAALLAWLTRQGLVGLSTEDPSDHQIAAYAAALGTWGWARRDPCWCHPADPPHHPFDFVV